MWWIVGNVTDYTLDYALSDGSHTFEVKAVDKAGNEGCECDLAFTLDATSPTVSPSISNVTAFGMSATHASIRWSTDEGATSQVEYGATSSYGSSSYLDSSLDTSHAIHLTELTADTTYHFRVKSSDACANEAASDDNTFSTVQPAPGVSILSHSLYRDAGGWYFVVGEVKNTGSQAVTYVEVVATFYNSVGRVVGIHSTSTMIFVVLANQKTPFQIAVLERTILPQIDHYELAIADAMVLPEQPYTTFTILNQSSSTNGMGYYEVAGRVQNTGSRTALLVTVSATFYDSAGTVVAVGSATTDPSTLAAGQTAPFDLSVSSSERSGEISSYELQVLGI